MGEGPVEIDGVLVGEPEGGSPEQAAAGCLSTLVAAIALPLALWWAQGATAVPDPDAEPQAALVAGAEWVEMTVAAWFGLLLAALLAGILRRPVALAVLGYLVLVGVVVAWWVVRA